MSWSGLNILAAIWLLISAWWLADSARAAWNVGIMGVVVFVLAALSATATEAATAARRL
jgi:hypothetical protein